MSTSAAQCQASENVARHFIDNAGSMALIFANVMEFRAL